MMKTTTPWFNTFYIPDGPTGFESGEDEGEDEILDEGEGSDFEDDFFKSQDGSSKGAKKADQELEDEEEYEDEEDDFEDDFSDEEDDQDEEDSESEDEEDDESSEDDEDSEDDAEDDSEAVTKAFLLKTIDTLSSGLDLNDVQAGEVVEQSFISDEEFDSFQDAESSEEMNKIFNKVYRKMIAISDRRANIIAGNKVSNQVQTAMTTDRFYSDNPELAGFKEVVISKAKSIFAKSTDRDLTLADLLDKAGTEVRDALGLKKGSKSKDDKKSPKATKKRVRKSPRVPGTRGGRKKKRTSKRSKQGLAAELDMFAKHNKRTRSL